MRRWLFAIILIGLMVALACGLESVDLLSAEVERIAFLLVPVVFMISSIIGLSITRA
ncbi:MAG TPA: hypothetical protein VFZ08_01785 [Terriglobia bacterium]|nr:hypothetical protein [Terriglobia bacterium]